MTTKSRKTNTPSAKTKTKSKSAAAPANRREREPAQADGNPSRQRVEDEIADRIIELLDKGELPPWEKGWRNSKSGDPVNALTMKPYRGVNRWLTLITQQSMGFDDPRWLTYRQAEGLGGYVRKGEKSTSIIFWKQVSFRQSEDGDQAQNQTHGNNGSNGKNGNNGNPPDESRTRTYPMLRSYRVFNVEQTQDCKVKPLPPAETTSHDPIEQAEAIIAGMPNPPEMEFYENANYVPHYQPATDVIRVPRMDRYLNLEDYYNTVFHELTPRHRALQAAGPLQPGRQRRRPPRLRPGGADRRDGLRHAGRPTPASTRNSSSGTPATSAIGATPSTPTSPDHTLRHTRPEGRGPHPGRKAPRVPARQPPTASGRTTTRRRPGRTATGD